ncbi:hypothetical protein ACTFIU_003735 [Dictyostelium citrinum]
MGRTSKNNSELPQEEPLTVTRSGRTIIKPNSVVSTPAKQTKKTTNKNQKLKESSDEEDSSENEEPILENQKNNKKKKESTTTVNRKEKKATTPKKKQQKKIKDSDDEDQDLSSSSSATPPQSPPQSSTNLTTASITTPTKKYTQEELDIITRENRNVYIKFFIFSILMVVVPLLVFKIFNTTIGDYLGISRQERVTYAGVASLGGLILVMAAYSIMAYYEK